MKKIIVIGIITLISIIGNHAIADSFGFYYRDNGFGMGMEFRDFDYYDRYSPGFYDNSEVDFRAALNPYGRWIYLGDFDGYVWVPEVSFGWRPYYNGSWTYTTYGWTWVAYEPWGWIPHHYGRWFYHPNYRWLWIPGTTWGPAYVTWGSYNGYYSWAPLPPRHCRFYSNYYRYNRGRYNRNHHYSYSDPYDRSKHWYSHASDYNSSNYRWIPNQAWTSVPTDKFMADNIANVTSDKATTARILRSGHFKKTQHAPFKDQIEKDIGRPISRMKVDEVVKGFNDNKIKIVRPVNYLKQKNHSVKNSSKKFIDNQTHKSQQPVNHNRKLKRNGSGSVHSTNKPDMNHQVKSRNKATKKPQHMKATKKPQHMKATKNPQHMKATKKPQHMKATKNPKHTNQKKKNSVSKKEHKVKPENNKKVDKEQSINDSPSQVNKLML